MTINARDVIYETGWFESHVIPDNILASLMEAADVEPGGRLVIEYADGWPVGRLGCASAIDMMAASTPKAHPEHRLVYRVVAP